MDRLADCAVDSVVFGLVSRAFELLFSAASACDTANAQMQNTISGDDEELSSLKG